MGGSQKEKDPDVHEAAVREATEKIGKCQEASARQAAAQTGVVSSSSSRSERHYVSL